MFIAWYFAINGRHEANMFLVSDTILVLAIWVLDFTVLATSPRACNFVSIDTGLGLQAMTIFWLMVVFITGGVETYRGLLATAIWLIFHVEIWGRDPWLSPIGHTHFWLLIVLVFRGESPVCRLFGTASMLEWLRNLLPHHSQGAVRKDGAEIPWGWSLPEYFTSSGGL